MRPENWRESTSWVRPRQSTQPGPIEAYFAKRKLAELRELPLELEHRFLEGAHLARGKPRGRIQPSEVPGWVTLEVLAAEVGLCKASLVTWLYFNRWHLRHFVKGWAGARRYYQRAFLEYRAEGKAYKTSSRKRRVVLDEIISRHLRAMEVGLSI